MTKDLYKDVDFKENLMKFIDISKKYKWYFIGVMIFAVIIEGARTLDKFLFKFVIDDGTELIAGTLSKAEYTQTLLLMAVIFGSALLVKVVFHWFQEGLIQKSEANMMQDIKVKFFNHIVHLDHNFHTTHKTGSLISRMNRGTRAAESMTDFFVYNITPLILQVVIIGVSLIFLDWTSAIVIVLISAAFISYGLFISNIQKKAHVDSYIAEDIETTKILEIWKIIRNRSKFYIRNWNIRTSVLLNKKFPKWKYNNWNSRIYLLCVPLINGSSVRIRPRN
jgi:ABC-type multidrug transport system fused ATPase/permease subunit